MISRTRRLTWRLERLFSALVALLWLASSATAATAASLPEGAYFRPLPPEASGRVGTSAAYRRSPCPAINALANHGYIARDGKAITAQALKAAAMKHFNVDSRYADTLVALAKKPVFNLDELSAHNVVEHDMSLVHKDAFYGQDPALPDAALVDDFVGHVGAAGVLDPWFFARTQQRRLRDCMANNPQCEYSNEFLLSVTLGRQGLLMRVMGGRNDEAVDLETTKMLLVDEKLTPTWARSSKPISQRDIQDSRERLFALLQASGEWLGDGFGTTSQQLVSDANAAQCLQVANKTLVVAACDGGTNAAQKFLLDGQQRLTTTSGTCIEVAAASNATGASIVEAACSAELKPSQQWRYDASGRLRPVFAPNLCLDIVTTPTAGAQPKVTTASCSTRSEQRFFAYYSNFQPSVSRLSSMDAPRFCLGLDVGATTSSALDLSPVVVTPCDSLDDAQELTLDESKRLVFTYDPTQCVDLGDSASPAALVQKPCSIGSTKWRYDSLSRLRPTASPSKCAQFPTGSTSASSTGATTQRRVALADCADGLAQKWFIKDTKNADIRPADQFYRPNVFESSGKPGTAAAYSRSPCPALNTLANHGLLPRSGRNLTAQQVKKAVVDHFNIDPAYAQVLVALANRTVFNLDDLSIHNAAEHDMSLVHADAFFGQDPAVADLTLAAELQRHVGASGAMDVLFFARTQARRLRQCQARNPQCDFSNEFLMSVALGRLGLLMRAMGGANQDRVDLARAKAFLLDEHFPPDFVRSPTPITQANIQETRLHVYALLKASSDWLVDGFLNSKTGVAVVSEGAGHALCLDITDGAVGDGDSAAALVVATCDGAANSQMWLLDERQRLVSASSGLCASAVDFGARAGSRVAPLECTEDDASNQQWTYDSSGRLRPTHAADLCLDVNSEPPVKLGTAVALGDCDATARQRFYSIYERFQPNVSHLNSIERPELCVGVTRASIDDGAAVEAAPCDPLLDEQQLTMDVRGRLVFKHSDKCLAASPDTPPAVVQEICGGAARQLWQYDSLGRLHSVATRSRCLALSGGSNRASASSLVLEDCGDAGVQRWFASDAKDPNSRPQNAYYRPNRDESSGTLDTRATYSRSPCPALNALANHGIISRDGRNLSRIDLVGAAVATFNLEPALAEALLQGLPDDLRSLDQLSRAAVFEYTGSLVHSDVFFNPDPAAIDPELVHDLFSGVGSDNGIDLAFFAAAQRRRLDAYAQRVSGSPSEAAIRASKFLKPGLVLRVMGGQNDEAASADAAKLLLVEERLPDGFVPPAAAVTLKDALDSATKAQALVETGATSASGAGGASIAWLDQPFRPKSALIFALLGGGDASNSDSDRVLCLSLANGAATLVACNATEPTQRFTYDAAQRLVVDATESCLDVVDGRVGGGAAVSHIDCTDWPHQKWTYDASGRLHPQHAPKFCLSVGAEAKGTIVKCSDAREQRFFAAFPALALRDQQLVSASPLTQLKNERGQRVQLQFTHCLSAGGGDEPLGVDQCDQHKAAQQLFSLDDRQRLAAIHAGSAATCVAPVGTELRLRDCADTSSATDMASWTYDSLGRLHLGPAMGRCLAAGTSADEPVRVEPCGSAASHRWLVARFTARTPDISIGGGGPGKESEAAPMRASPRGRWMCLLIVLAMTTLAV